MNRGGQYRSNKYPGTCSVENMYVAGFTADKVDDLNFCIPAIAVHEIKNDSNNTIGWISKELYDFRFLNYFKETTDDPHHFLR